MFITYLLRELRRRMRQAIFIAAGLALGVGLVITVTAASDGVSATQGTVLRSLYGVGTRRNRHPVPHGRLRRGHPLQLRRRPAGAAKRRHELQPGHPGWRGNGNDQVLVGHHRVGPE
jgi:hypothetical protein